MSSKVVKLSGVKTGYWLTRGCLVAHVGSYRDTADLFLTAQQESVARAGSNFWSGTITPYRLPLMTQNFYWTKEGFCRPDGVESELDIIQFISREMPCREYIDLYNCLVVHARESKVSKEMLLKNIVCKALLQLAAYTLDQHATLRVKKYIPAINSFRRQIERLANPYINYCLGKNGKLTYTDKKSLLYQLLAGTPNEQSVVIEKENLHLLMELVHTVAEAPFSN